MIIRAASLFIVLAASAAHAKMSVVPLRIEKGTLSVSVKIDGFEGTCLVDTGAEESRVPADSPFFSGYAPTASSHEGISGPQSVDEIGVKSLRVGSLALENVKVLRAGGFCLLGMDVFGGRALELRFGANPSLAVDDAGSSPDAEDGRFILAAEVGGAPVNALWDTGAGMTVVDRGYVAAHADAFSFVREGRTWTDSAGNPVATQYYRAKSIVIGDLRLTDEAVVVADLSRVSASLGEDIPMLIGFNLISKADWSFDPKSGRWSAATAGY